MAFTPKPPPAATVSSPARTPGEGGLFAPKLPPGAKARKPKKTVGGLLGNLAGDVADFATGLGPGLATVAKATATDIKNTAEHPLRQSGVYNTLRGTKRPQFQLERKVINPLKQQYQQTYGPVAHGDLGPLYEHPLGPVLDALTVVSAGAGAAGKAARAAGATGRLSRIDRAGVVKLESPAVKQGLEGGKVLEKPTSARPVRKAVQVAADKASKALPYQTPVVGEAARYARELDRLPRREARRLELKLRPYQKAYGKLSEAEQVALGVLGRGLQPGEYKQLLLRQKAAGQRVEDATVQLMDRPDVRAAAAAPSPALLDAIEKGREAAQTAADILKQRDRLTAETATERPYMAARIARSTADPGSQLSKLLAPERVIPSEYRAPEGALFHGSPEGELGNIDALYHTKMWAEGPGFYATTSPEKAAKYAAGKTAKATRRNGVGAINVVKLKPGTKVLNMDQQPEDFWRGLAEQITGLKVDAKTYRDWASLAHNEIDSPALKNASIGVRNRNGLLEYLMGFEEMPRTDAYYAIEEALHARGIQATLHHENGVPVYIVKDASAIERKGVVPPAALEPRVIPAAAPSVEELRAQFQREGRIEPFYLPDKATQEKVFVGRAGGGMGVPRNPVHQTEGVLLRTGQIALQPDVLSPAYLGSVRYALHDDLHQGLLDSAVKVGKGQALPSGYQYIRRPSRPGGTSAEKIPYTQKTLGDFRDQAAELLPQGEQPRFTTSDTAEAVTSSDGFYLAIPKTLGKQAAGQFLRSSQGAKLFLDRPTQVWRALVLNLRPAWLVNNLVGNHLLYAVKFGGLDGLWAYARAVREVGNDTGAFRKLVEEFVPEQVQGTFLNTQRPAAGRRVQNAATLGLSNANIGSEQMLRRAAIETALRRDPQLRTTASRMYQQGMKFEDVARQAFQDDPLLARRVSDQVNDALGDFLNMGVFERQVVRSLFPFYGWYKAILQITAKTPLDYPGRSALLARVAQAGADETQQALGDIPSYLKGAVVVSRTGSRAKVVNTTGLNPYATIPSLASDVSGTVNPFAAGAARAILGTDPHAPNPLGQALKNFGTGAADLVTGLPEVRLGQAFTGSLYQGTPSKPTLYNRTPRDELLAFLGIPYRDMSLVRARQLAKDEKKK